MTSGDARGAAPAVADAVARDPASLPLSEHLRIATRDAHTAAERSGIMQPLLRGTIARTSYVALLESLAPMYEALETALARHAGRPALAFVELPLLARAPRLREDIAALRAPGDAVRTMPVAASAYVERLRTIDREHPDLLLAHAYVRYLGDLSGGRILMRIVGRSLGITGAAGLAFYDFPGIADPEAFKRRFRDGMDAVPLDVHARDAIAGEALDGFRRHEALFTELADDASA